METIVHSFEVLALCMEVGLTMLGTALAVAGGALLALKLAPFSPSQSLLFNDAREAFYNEVQGRLSMARARRRESSNRSDDTTKPAVKRDEDLTQPDLTLTESFSVVPMRTVSVGGVRALPVLQVR